MVPEPLEKEPLEGKKTEVKNNPPEKDVKIEKASEKEPEIKKESETEKTQSSRGAQARKRTDGI